MTKTFAASQALVSAWIERYQRSDCFVKLKQAASLAEARAQWDQIKNLLLCAAALQLYRKQGLLPPADPGPQSWDLARSQLQYLFQTDHPRTLRLGRNINHCLAQKLWGEAQTLSEKYLKTRNLGSEWTPPDVLGELLQSLLARQVLPAKPPATATFTLSFGRYRKQWGIHFTPSSLCQALVAKTLTPALIQAQELSPKLEPAKAVIKHLRICDPALGAGAFLVEALAFLEKQLADPLADLKQRQSLRAQLAQHCLFGVDRDPFAVDIARVNLDLCTRRPSQPPIRWEDKLKWGDSLLWVNGAEVRAGRLEAPSLSPVPSTATWNTSFARRRFRSRAALLISEHFDRSERVSGRERPLLAWLSPQDNSAENKHPAGPPAAASELRNRIFEVQSKKIPFHWELEFPELCASHPQRSERIVAILGNPPFLGGRYITQEHGQAYNRWLGMRSQAQATADFCAHFVGLAQKLAEPCGVIGLLLSASITHDASRKPSLEALLRRQFHLYDAQHQHSWLGEASVAISTFCASRGFGPRATAPVYFNGQSVSRLNARLQPAQDWEPKTHQSGTERSPFSPALSTKIAFQGTNVRGEGFFVPSEQARDWCEQDPLISNWIKDFFDGRSLRAVPLKRTTRLILDVGKLSLEELKEIKPIFHWLDQKVRPQRLELRQAAAREQWWRFWNRRTGLYQKLAPLQRCIATVLVSRHVAFDFADTANRVFGHKLGVFALDQDWHLALLQSRVHIAWAWYHSGQRGHHSLNYAPTKCFDNFIPPHPWKGSCPGPLQSIATEFVDLRQKAQCRQGLGLSQFYRRLHDPKFDEAWLRAQRELHRELDAAVLASYGWQHLTLPTMHAPLSQRHQFQKEILETFYRPTPRYGATAERIKRGLAGQEPGM